MTREQKVAQAQELRATGLKLRDIGERLGLSVSAAGELLYDPDLSKARARKAKTDGVCDDCGGRTVSDGRAAGPPRRCADCARKNPDGLIWPRERIVEAIHSFAAEYGAPPSATDWNVSDPRCDTPRFYAHDWPHYNSVQGQFGSWNAAIAAAGFTPRRGYKRGLSDEERNRRIALYREGHSLKRIADICGVTPNAIADVLDRAGVRSPRTPRREPMSAFNSALKVIDREIERHEARITRLREEADQLVQETDKLRAAREQLATDDKPDLKAA